MKIQNTTLLPNGAAAVGLLLVIALGFNACNEVNVNGNQDPGRMNLYLTDAPGDFQQVNIDVQTVRIHFSADGDTAQTDTTDNDSEETGEWIDLPAEPFKINLLDLTGVDTLIASADLEPGRYNQLRLILGEDNDVMVDSVIHPLMTPSGQESGYKIIFNTLLEFGKTLDVTLDFDAGQSVVQTGNGEYLLKPVLQAFEGRNNNGGDDEES